MSHAALSRVVVRMHFDPAFVEAVHRDPEGVLAPLGIEAEEREDLLAVDRRAFAVDTLRRTRALRNVVDEYPVASLLVLAATRRIAVLDAFFSSAAFHDEVQRRGSLAAAFGRYLAGLAGTPGAAPQLPEVIRLEATSARLRRELEAPPPPPPRGRHRRAPAVAGLRLDGSVLEVINAVERWRFETALLPGLSLCDDAPGLPPLPAPRPAAPLHLVAAPDRGRIVLTEPGRAAVEALIALEEPQDEAAFVAGAAARGLRPDLGRRLLGDLRAAGFAVHGE